MKIIVIGLIVTLLIYIALKGSQKVDPKLKDCSKEIIQLLKNRHDASAEEMAEIAKQYEISDQEVDDLTTLIKAKLHQTNINKNRHAVVMLEVRKIKSLM